MVIGKSRSLESLLNEAKNFLNAANIKLGDSRRVKESHYELIQQIARLAKELEYKFSKIRR